jgi:hypothetical protein
VTTPIPGSLLFSTIITATKVTVIPITNTGLIAITGADDKEPCCAFPTTVKPHPRVATEAAADRLLTQQLGCVHGVLRQPGHPHREAVYTSVVWWPDHHAAHTHDGGAVPGDGDGDGASGDRPQWVTIACRDDADRHRLQLGRLARLPDGPDLLAAARALPDLTSPPPDPGRPRSRRRAATAAPDSSARRFR